MIPPVRCFTCGKVIADKYDFYVSEKQKLEKKEEAVVQTAAAKKKKGGAEEPPAGMRHFDGIQTKPILDKLGLTRYCCRRMMLGIEDMMDKI
jgi:DNA-directed RNA polymerase subunit N (RpoN/RPB10)